VNWMSTLQTTIALSTMAAQYLAVIEAIKEAIYLQGLIEDLGIHQEYICVFCEN
jgi:hypothetical protein